MKYFSDAHTDSYILINTPQNYKILTNPNDHVFMKVFIGLLLLSNFYTIAYNIDYNQRLKYVQK